MMTPRMRTPTPGILRSLLTWTTLGLAGLAVGAGLERMVLDNFSVCPAYYPPPHQTQMQYFLEGARGQPLSSNLYLVSEAKLQHFRTNGERELIVQAPQCAYDSTRRSVSSAGSLRVMAAEGKFSITGEGFLWQQTNTSLAISNGASLAISNRVHSIVHRDLLARGEAQAPMRSQPAGGADLEVFSDQFDYATDSGRGNYRRNVRVTGTNLNLTAGLLSLDVPMHEHQLRRVTAEEAVVVDYQGVHASGDLATYSPITDLLEVTGHPAWQDGEIRGHGSKVTIDATNRIFLTEGDAFLRMPGRGLGVTGLLPSTNASAPQGSNTFVEVYCDSYDLRTNRAVFQNNVRLSELAGAALKGRMSCGQMAVTYANTNQLERMVADRNVIIEHESQRLTGAHAIYDATNGVLDLIDHPAWQDGPREGKGDSIKVNRQREEMLVLGNASMRLPAAQMGAMSFTPGTVTPVTNAGASTNEFAEIFSDAYSVSRDAARFEGHVRIVHPRIIWACEEMTVGMPSAGGRVGKIVADRAVEFDLLDEKGEKTHGTGDRAVYTCAVTDAGTNEVIRLTGNPMLTQSNFTWAGEVLELDCLRQKITSPAPYGIRLITRPLTNAVFQSDPKPKGKSRKR